MFSLTLLPLAGLAAGSALFAQEPASPPLRPNTAPAGTALVWDALEKEITADASALAVTFSFSVINRSSGPILIERVETSCACSVAKPPADPWLLAPGARDTLTIEVDLRGKSGALDKEARVVSTAGVQSLRLRVKRPPPAPGSPEARLQNAQLAVLDRQAVFKGDCARCHAEPARGLQGAALYAAVCAICHDAAPRASMVPDLAALPRPLVRADWSKLIAEGRPGTLMPAFSTRADHGPLDDAQIESLVEYLTERFQHHNPGGSPPAAPVVSRRPKRSP